MKQGNGHLVIFFAVISFILGQLPTVVYVLAFDLKPQRTVALIASGCIFIGIAISYFFLSYMNLISMNWNKQDSDK